MSSSQSCSNCGLALVLESQLTLCPTCLRATGKIADDHTLLELIEEISPTKSSEDRHTTAEFLPGSSPILHFELKPFRDPQFATFTAWEQAQIVELGRRGYRVQSKLGDGGFGVVFLAVDSAERLVAVKMLHAALTEDRYRQRFAIEANALSLLDDPALVKLYHYDVSGPDPMLVTEFVPGGTLAKQLHGCGIFESAEATEVIRQLAEVVHKVHGAGLVHRDIKPSNILIGSDGRYKLGDFGLAKRLDRDDDLTPTGRGIGGTPEYSAPEQFRSSGDCDGRADIYALGATLYRLLTGKPVFERKGDGDFVGVILRVLSEEPVPPRRLRPEIPRALEAVCLKCLAKNPAERYRTAAELAADLQAWRTGADDMIARPSTLAQRVWRGVRRMPKFPVAMILVALLGLGAAFLIMKKDDGPKPEPDVLVVMQKELEADGRLELVGATGLPRWHRWAIGGPELVQSSTGDATNSFEAMDVCALELLPTVSFEHFKLVGQMRFVASKAGAQEPDRPFAGLYVGGQESHDAHGHSLYTLAGQYFEDGPSALADKTIRFKYFRILRQADSLPMKGRVELAELGFQPTAVLPGPWRTFEIEASAKSLIPRLESFDLRPGSVDRGLLQIAIESDSRILRKNPALAGLIVPAWNHKTALGLWAYRAGVDFRNVSLIRLP